VAPDRRTGHTERPGVTGVTDETAAPGAPCRPDRLVLVVGTGTEVGKTWVSARLLSALGGAGWRVEARKPAQSFDPNDPPGSTDAEILAAVTGEAPTDVCPDDRWFPVALAPPMAADALGRPAFTVADLAASVRWRGGARSVGLVETAGGVRSPQAADGDALDMVRLLAPDVVVVVASAGLGTVNGVRLTADALDAAGSGAERVVVLNRFDPDQDLHRRNLRWLTAIDGYRVVTTPGDIALLAEIATGARITPGSPH
jgi:dethiobiotin synthetase